jgi:phosphoribosyl-ATP pyrophosphohydrolase/phosphoribosyl-AMP cyclohydrolase
MTGLDLDSLAFDDRGLVPVVCQDVATGAVLMVAWANREALEATVETGLAHFWSRSRGKLWQKGETSGNRLEVVKALADCDRDTLLLRVLPTGPACHRGTRTCFEPNPAHLELGWLSEILDGRKGADPGTSYTAKLLSAGTPRVAQKLGEEAVETVIAALGGGGESSDYLSEDGSAETDPLASEAADLLYHLLVLLVSRGVEPGAVAAELARRHRSQRTTRSAP